MNSIKVDKFPIDPGPAAWNAILPEIAGYASLTGNETADFVVIGAGFAGLATARRLRQIQPTASIVVLEARRIAEGPAGRNSGFMIDLPHNLTSDDYAGALDADRMNMTLNRAAIEFASGAAKEYGMPAEAFARSGKINGAATQKGDQHNQDYAKHLAKLGEEHTMFDATQMKEICGTSYYMGGLYTPGTAMLQPAMFVRYMAAGLTSQNVRICENSAVVGLSKNGTDWTAKTKLGSVQSPKVILAVNGHAESFGFYKRRLMHIYLYASMTRPLDAVELKKLGGKAVWGLTPADPMGTTVRKISGVGGTRIVVRNRVSWNPSRVADPSCVRSFGSSHDNSLAARFPALKNISMEYRWGGQLCLSRNSTSAFGEVDSGLYSACCQNGLGTAKGTSNGMLIAELASGIQSDHLDYMTNQANPTKLPPEPFSSIGAKAFLRWGEFQAGAEL